MAKHSADLLVHNKFFKTDSVVGTENAAGLMHEVGAGEETGSDS